MTAAVVRLLSRCPVCRRDTWFVETGELRPCRRCPGRVRLKTCRCLVCGFVAVRRELQAAAAPAAGSVNGGAT